MLAGKEFQAAGPAWLKQRSPFSLVRAVDKTDFLSVFDWTLNIYILILILSYKFGFRFDENVVMNMQNMSRTREST